MIDNPKLVIFESHPIQYRVPVYQKLNELRPNSFYVIFASDFSVQGYSDPGFGSQIAWDVPLLEGYPYKVLNPGSKSSPRKFLDLTAPGLFNLLEKLKPSVVLMTSFNYRFDMVAYFCALRCSLPLWIRMETQDQAFPRSKLKSWLRSLAYKCLYQPVQRAFYIGQLNKQHYSKHGLNNDKLFPAHYCTSNLMHYVSYEDKVMRRQSIRQSLNVDDKTFLISFFGKFIYKKDPLILLDSIYYLSGEITENSELIFIGNGELQTNLKTKADKLFEEINVKSHFPGFINQSNLSDWYLAVDVVVLPSRKMGETWGLVINEALHAGCGVVVSNAVGCHEDFKSWPRVRTFPTGDVKALAAGIESLFAFSRDFNWANQFLQDYSIDSAANSLAEAIDTL
ncbi:glycosyltransferase family 4 protein [Acaryochloris marina]|uniref:glycosyltransferase family 4 protein n=1 Tax=Acaryochloris marina TaxID=155978 RepID=UPI0021C49DA6|nr:glycosyltransferase family 4 protein [Acaryochloris marina]BDM80328.1 hypothetical protein AM10699_31960 [Acaryochloris marina MBIC10699]